MSRATVRELGVGADREPATLALRVHGAPEPRAGAVLVHGLASNARMWDACAEALSRAGVVAVAVDLRGHGRTAALPAGTAGPHDTATAAADVTEVVAALRADGTLPARVVLAGQSWGGNVVLHAAAVSGAAVDALALVDGGWLRFDRDEPFEDLWRRLAPPSWDGATWESVRARVAETTAPWGPHALPAVLGNLTTGEDGRVRNVLDRDAHEQILRSMWSSDPRELYGRVDVPVLLAPAGGSPAAALVSEAVALLPRSDLRRYDDAHHDLHLQHPRRLAADLVDALGLVRTPTEDS